MLLPGSVFLTLIVLASSECANNESRNIFLWSVRNENSGAQGYLFGTIHVPYTEVWDRVSDRVRDAFALSDTVLLEVDLNNEDTLRKLVRCKKLPRKQTALSYLPQELFARIKTFMSKFRQHLTAISAQNHEEIALHAQQMFDNVAGSWHRKRPEWLLFTLYQLCENLLDRSKAPMLDVFLATKALEENKSLEALESAEEQCNPVSSLPLDDIVFAIDYTMKFLENLYFGTGSIKKERSLTELIQHYRCGSLEQQLLNNNEFQRNVAGISQKEKERANMIDQTLKDDIIIKRNERMAARVDNFMSLNPSKTVFTAIGTGHFMGKRSIISQLQERGYTVNAVKNDDVLSPRKSTGTKFKPLWTRDFVPAPPLVVIELVESSCSFCVSIYFSLFVLLLSLV